MASKTELELENEELKRRLAAAENGSNGMTETEKKLLNAQAALLDAAEKKLPPKPYTSEEMAEHKAAGHVIGMPTQKLSTGHNAEDLQKWDLWKVQLKVRGPVFIPEIDQKWAVPHEITPMKIERPGLSGNDISFQKMNCQFDFRNMRTENDDWLIYLPSGMLEAGKTYKCDYWIKTVDAGKVSETKLCLIDIIGYDRIIGKK